MWSKLDSLLGTYTHTCEQKMRDFCKSRKRKASEVRYLCGYKLIIELKNAVVECAEFHEKYCRVNCTEQGKGIEM